MLTKLLFALSILTLPVLSNANGAGQTVEQIYYCGDDFAMKMSGGDWYLVQKSRVGEKKLDHFLSMAMLLITTDKKTANVFPQEGISWCGNKNFKPITIFSIAK